MGIMNFLRERMGAILAVVIGIALFAFVIGEVARSGSSLMQSSASEVGVVSGKTVSYEEYQKSVDDNVKNFQQQSGGALTPQLTAFAQESAWNQILSKTIFDREIERVGIVVGAAELHDMVQGKDPSPQIKQYFGDPKTGEVDRARLNMFLTQMNQAKKDDAGKVQWNQFLGQMEASKKVEKYLTLVRNGLYINALDAKDDYEAKNKLVNFKYAELPYTSLADNQVTLTDADYKEYYDEHKALFKNNQELRSFEYVSFDAAPSKEDSAAVKKQAETLLTGLKASTDDSLFVQVNAETKAPLVFQRKGQLDPQLDSVMFKAEKGFVYGPVLTNGSYKIAKLVDTRVGPDSVKASHILLNPAQEGGIEQATKKADSLKKLIQGGASFAELAKKYSSDKTSGEKGGDLGTFGRGAMVPAFDDAVFSAPKGELKIVTTQFGVHLYQVNQTIGSSKVVKVAVVDKPLIASSNTQSVAYSKAQTFLANVTGSNFAEQTKKQGLIIKPAADVNGTATSAAGLENAREVVKWAFTADIGDLPEKVFSVGNQFIVPRLSEIKEEGQLPVEKVKKQIENEVRQMVKGKKLAEKVQNALSGASSIDQVAQKLGVAATPVQNIVFANPVIPGLSPEYKLVGTIFGSPLNKLSKPVIGQHGVYAFVVDGFVNPAPMTNALRQKQQIEQTILQRADNLVFDALKDKAKVKDYRAKFL